MSTDIAFKKNNLMPLKPALHPFDFTPSINKNNKKDSEREAVSSNNKNPTSLQYKNFQLSRMTYQPEKFDRSNSSINSGSQLPVIYSKQDSVLEIVAKKKFKPPQNYVPQFSVPLSKPISQKNLPSINMDIIGGTPTTHLISRA